MLCKYFEMVSEYADGELKSKDDIVKIQAHIKKCESCNAFYLMVQEIKEAVIETKEQPPAALKKLIMSQVENEPSFEQRVIKEASKEDNIVEINQVRKDAGEQELEGEKSDNVHNAKNKSRKIKFILTRIAPLAASIALVVMVWQFWGDIVPVPADLAPAAFDTSAIPESLEVAQSDSDDDAYLSQSEPPALIEDSAENYFQTESGGTPERAAGDQHDNEQDESSDIVREGEFGYPQMLYEVTELTDNELNFIENYFSYASMVVVVFSSNIADDLISEDPQLFPNIEGVESIYEITTLKAETLIENLAYRTAEFRVLLNDTASNYAVVLLMEKP